MEFMSVEEIQDGILFKLRNDSDEIIEICLPQKEMITFAKQTFQILTKNMTSQQQREFLQIVQRTNTRRIIDESY